MRSSRIPRHRTVFLVATISTTMTGGCFEDVPDGGADTESEGGGSDTATTSDAGTTDGGTTGSATDTGQSGETLTVFPARTECGERRVDEIDHEIGDSFNRVPDDIRTGSCSPDPCAREGTSGPNGVDLEFELGLPSLRPFRRASVRLRGITNGDVAGTTEIHDAATDTQLGRCTIQSSNGYGECVAELDTELLDLLGRDTARMYTVHDDPGCYLVYDFFELTVEY